MKLSRRTVLRGFGTTVALPFLASLGARAQQAPERRRRFVAVMATNGVNISKWNGTGQDGLQHRATITSLAQSPAMQPLLDAGLGGQVTMVNGLYCRHRPPAGAGAHHRGVAGFLTAATSITGAYKLCSAPPATGYETCAPDAVSLDQLLAQRLQAPVRYRSLELGPYGNSIAGGDCGGAACNYLANISWRDGVTPQAREPNPQVAFDRLFAGSNAAETDAARAQRLARRTRVLDAVQEDTRRVRAKLGASDRLRLDQYLESVVALEDQLRAGAPGPACRPGARPADGLNPFTSRVAWVRAFHDVIVLALQCDLTRVVTMMLGGGGNGGSYNYADVLSGQGPRGGTWRFADGTESYIEQAAHHELSHWATAEGFAGTPPDVSDFFSMKLQALHVIDKHRIAELALLLQKLHAVKEEGGYSLLDNTLLYWGNELSDPYAHSTENLPVLLCGGAAGALGGGRVINTDDSVANLFIGIAAAFGVPLSRFGNDGTRPVPGVFG